MKKKEAAKDEDGLIETDGWEEEQHSKKLFDRNTVFLVIIFSLTFFILGNATGFFCSIGQTSQGTPILIFSLHRLTP